MKLEERTMRHAEVTKAEVEAATRKLLSIDPDALFMAEEHLQAVVAEMLAAAAGCRAASRSPDAECRAAALAHAEQEGRIQGFRCGEDVVIRDVSLPQERQELWRGHDGDEFRTRLAMERMRFALDAAARERAPPAGFVRHARHMDALDAHLEVETWLEGLRSRHASPVAVESFGLRLDDPTALPNGRVTVAWSMMRQIGVATVTRDDFNFSVVTIVEPRPGLAG